MTTSQTSPIETFLADLAACLPATATTGDMLCEARDHLLEAAAARKAAGASQQTAERDAVREFGRIEELAPDFRTVVLVRDAQRQARWQLATVALLGACGISAFRLVPLLRGEFTGLVPPPTAAVVAAAALVCPSVVLLALSRTPRSWHEAGWTAWLVRARALATCLFVLGLPLCAAMVADQVTVLISAPRVWLLAGALAGFVTVRRLVPTVMTGGTPAIR